MTIMSEALKQNKSETSRNRRFLVAVMLTNLTTMLNTSTVNISLPSYMSIFNVDINTVQWVVIGYLLPLGMMMPLAGYLCERYSYRKVFLTAMAVQHGNGAWHHNPTGNPF